MPPARSERPNWRASSLWAPLGRPCSERAVDIALTYAERRRRAFDPAQSVLVHGDAHQWNTLSAPGSRTGFKLIDPDGAFAERAFDLAIENIYTRTRRVLARHAGVDYNRSRSEIASRIASRGTIDGRRLETLMRRCEGVINGEPCSWRESIDLVRRLREVERDLGLRMRSREERQAAENI